ncbi:MAG: hypothetical protein V1738_06535 [Patescibacteria group bacterium]
METKYLLPQNNWRKMLHYIKLVGENGTISNLDSVDDYYFWEELGVFEKTVTSELSENGKAIFESIYIRRDGNETEIFKQLLLAFPPTIALQQYLWGILEVSVDQALTVLKTTGSWVYNSNEPLTHFLDFLNFAGVITYNKRTRAVKILISPDAPRVPRNVFIDPSRPFSNILWIKRVIGECSGSILWLDKHFQKEGLEWIWSIADAEKITEIRILSLDMGDKNLGSDAKNTFKRFRQEMTNKGINASWATIDSKEIRDIHDRWILDGVGYLRNVPNVNAISSGQRSELNLSENYDEARHMFEEYWLKGAKI